MSLMLPSKEVAESNNKEVIGFIASTVEAIRDRVGSVEQNIKSIEQRMVTKDDLARLDGRLNERLDAATTSIRGDIEQVHLRLNSMEHSLSSRFEQVEGEISRLRSAVYVLGKDRPDVLRLLGHQSS